MPVPHGWGARGLFLFLRVACPGLSDTGAVCLPRFGFGMDRRIWTREEGGVPSSRVYRFRNDGTLVKLWLYFHECNPAVLVFFGTVLDATQTVVELFGNRSGLSVFREGVAFVVVQVVDV